MNEWLPILAGYGGLILIILVTRLFPRSWLGTELRRWYGAQPRGAYAVMTRRDHLRRALYSAGAAVFLVGSTFALYPLSDRYRNGSAPSLVLQAYSFIAFILGAVAGLAAVLAALSAAVWRRKQVKLSPAQRADLAACLELMSRGELPYEAWRDFDAVYFDDRTSEAIRAEYVKRVGPKPRELSDDDARWLQNAAVELRNPPV